MGSIKVSDGTSADATTLITEEEVKIYDRQIRLWGFDIQQR